MDFRGCKRPLTHMVFHRIQHEHLSSQCARKGLICILCSTLWFPEWVTLSDFVCMKKESCMWICCWKPRNPTIVVWLWSDVQCCSFPRLTHEQFLDIRKYSDILLYFTHSFLRFQVLFNGTTAIGVEVHSNRNKPKQKFYASREVILSAGTARSPQILLLSGVGPKSELDKFNVRPNDS